MQFLTSGRDMLKNQPDFTLVGRTADLQRLTSVLLRNKAASAILVGPGGVGTSALIMGLQALKDTPDVPFDVMSKRSFWLKTDELFSSGDHETISKGFAGVLNILERTPDSILIIEDTKDFLEASRNSGCSHFINSLNACLKAGKTQVILEVRDEDIELVLAAHSDMKQCYTIVDLNEPIGEDLLNIVKQSTQRLSNHHGINVDEDAVHAAIDLTNKYRSKDSSLTRAQPERSCNLIDRALASYRLNAHKRHPEVIRMLASGIPETDATIVSLDAEFAKMQARIKELYRLQRDGEIAVIELEEYVDKLKQTEASKTEEPSFQSVRLGMDSEEVRTVKEQIRQLNVHISSNKTEFDQLTASINNQLLLTPELVYEEFSRLSGIPVAKLTQNELDKLRNLETTLNSYVYGQTRVISKIANAIKVARIDKVAEAPLASFLIMGPSGTGKTEVSKALAIALKDDAEALCRFDMSEYKEKHSISKLIGAPAGYEGSDRSGILTTMMRQNPNRIILFDEIEKADPDIFDLFLQILSPGRLTDNRGLTVNFSESIIIMTTNIGQKYLLDESLPYEEAEKLANAELESVYRPEFLNRIGGRHGICCFERLGIDSILKIVMRELNKVKESFKSRNLSISFTEENIAQFCNDHYNTKHGARGLQGYVTAYVRPLIVNLILDKGVVNAKISLNYNTSTKAFEASVTE